MKTIHKTAKELKIECHDLNVRVTEASLSPRHKKLTLGVYISVRELLKMKSVTFRQRLEFVTDIRGLSISYIEIVRRTKC